ncbi:MAG: type II toxin-antitoxin system RelE/ParE family toxin [Planctomycetes bacterium]|nr:type II toxin-antitoxin system RelE/ParE family toxin [Planctomycetota bacterium]
MSAINWTRKAAKQLRKIPSNYQKRIVTAVSELVNFPNCKGDIKKLVNRDGYRLRLGNYRIIFDDIGTIIEIQEVKKRDNRTY